jgi:hypothetical protein
MMRGRVKVVVAEAPPFIRAGIQLAACLAADGTASLVPRVHASTERLCGFGPKPTLLMIRTRLLSL